MQLNQLVELGLLDVLRVNLFFTPEQVIFSHNVNVLVIRNQGHSVVLAQLFDFGVGHPDEEECVLSLGTLRN